MYRPDLAHIHHEGFSEFASSAAPGIIAILRSHGIAGGLVIDAGCGSGILARELVRAGYDVAGFDPSPAMIALARASAPAAAFEVASLDEAVLPGCRAVTATGEVLNHAGFHAARAFIDEASCAIGPGGLLLFDFAETGGPAAGGEMRAGGPDWSVIVTEEQEGTDLVRRVRTFREAGGEVRRDEETHRIEFFERAALTAALRAAGFRVRVRRSYGSRRLPAGRAVCVAVRR